MRNTLIQTLIDIAEADERPVLLTGDLGFSVVEPFRDKFPDRFFNVGVAEQNMVGIATGLAMDGLIPFVYSIATFATLRPYEFIRNGPVAHNLPVRIIGIGGGFEYGHAGSTHFALEDYAVFRALPGIRIIAPADKNQCRNALNATWNLDGPSYYRISKQSLPCIDGLEAPFKEGGLTCVRQGKDLAIITFGAIAHCALEVAEILAGKNIDPAVYILSSIYPSPIDDLKISLEQTTRAFTIEEHRIDGGVGSLIAEVIAENNIDCKLTRFGIGGKMPARLGNRDFLMKQYGLTPDQIAARILATIN